MATNRFINVNGGEWNTAANWLLDDDGVTARVPLSTDDVVITASLGVGKTITATTTNMVAKSIDFSTAGNAFIFTPSVYARIYGGNVTLKSGMTVTVISLQFYSAGTSIFTPNSVSLIGSAIRMLNQSAGTATLSLAEDINLGTGSLTFGTTIPSASNALTTNDHQVTCGVFGDDGSSRPVTLTLGSSTINCTNVSFAAATLTVSHTGALNITSTVDITANFGGQTWAGQTTVLMTGGKVMTLNGANTFDKFALSWTADNKASGLKLGANQVFTNATADSLKITGATTIARPYIISSAIGTQRTLTAKTTTITGAMDFQDIKGAGDGSWNLSSIASGNRGGNSGITFRTAASYYACTLTANRNWSANIWSAADDGSADGTGVFPLPQDTAVINNNTGDSSNKVLTVDMPHICGIDASALTETLTLALGTASYYGDLILTGSGLTVTSSSATVSIDSRVRYEDGSDTLDVNCLPAIGTGAVTVGIYAGQTGTVRLLTNNLTHTGTFTLSYGTFDLNGLTLSTNIFSSSNSNTRVLQDSAGNGKIIVTGLTGTIFDMSTTTGLTVNNAPAIDIGTSNLTQTADVTFAGGGKTFGAFKVTKHA